MESKKEINNKKKTAKKRSQNTNVAPAKHLDSRDVARIQNVELKKATKVIGQLTKRTPKKSALQAYGEALANPFANTAPICPVNFNPAPSMMVTTARMTHTNLSVLVPHGTSLQYTFYPGHSEAISDQQASSFTDAKVYSTMDAQAFHCKGSVAWGTVPSYATIGPVATHPAGGAHYAPCAGFVQPTTLDTYSRETALPNVTPLYYDVPLPYEETGTIGDQLSGHARHQLVSMGVRIFNTTPVLSRGGNVVTVQFATPAGLLRQTAGPMEQKFLEIEPSFKVHGDGGDGIEVSWIPRVQDLAYWHGVRGGNLGNQNSVQSQHGSAAMCVFLNNSAPADQAYSIQVVFNWMLSGQYYQSVSAPAIVEPILRPQVEQGIIHMQNNVSTASVAPMVFKAASATVAEAGSMASKLTAAGFEGAKDAMHAVGAGANFVTKILKEIH